MTTEEEFVAMMDRLHDVAVTHFRLNRDVEEAVTACEDRLANIEGRLRLLEKNWE